ncbi:MAG: dihydrolipoamide acetyltransferase family protein [Anaerolineales bacterium]
MAKEFKLPDLGEGIHEGEVLDVKVSKGDQVEEDQTILEVETDKAAVEIPSPYSDIVTDIRVEPGDVVHVGDVLMTFGGTGDNVPQEKAEEPEPEEAEEPEPEEAEEPEGAERPAKAPPKEREERERGEPKREGVVPAAPSTRRIARELGVDLHDVPPSGPGGRVTTKDVRAYAEGERPEKAPEREERAPEREERERKPLLMGVSTWEEPPSLPTFEKFGDVERVPLRSVRRATARQMALAWSQIPHVSTEDLVDITELERLRRRYKDEVDEQGGSLTLTVFALKALTNALKQHPKFNASLDVAKEEIVIKKYYNIGVAVDSERGLIVPVIRDVDRKSILELSQELAELVERTRKGEAGLEDMQGGTLTITNIGPLGGTSFAPIINFPEVAILGLAQANIQPVARRRELGPGESYDSLTEGYDFVPRLMLPLILSFDHRVNDGAEAQRFMNALIEQFENPEKLLLGL